MNARMSREMESMTDFMQTQISRAISCAISDRILLETQNIVKNLPLNQHGVSRVRPQLRIESEKCRKTQIRNLLRRTPGPPVI